MVGRTGGNGKIGYGKKLSSKLPVQIDPLRMLVVQFFTKVARQRVKLTQRAPDRTMCINQPAQSTRFQLRYDLTRANTEHDASGLAFNHRQRFGIFTRQNKRPRVGCPQSQLGVQPHSNFDVYRDFFGKRIQQAITFIQKAVWRRTSNVRRSQLPINDAKRLKRTVHVNQFNTNLLGSTVHQTRQHARCRIEGICDGFPHFQCGFAGGKIAGASSNLGQVIEKRCHHDGQIAVIGKDQVF